MRAAAVVVLLGWVGLIAIAVAWYVQVSIAVGSGTAYDGSFAARLDGQVRLLIVGEPDIANALRSAILEADDADLIAEDRTPSEPDGADAMLVLLNGWDDIATAPWAMNAVAEQYGDGLKPELRALLTAADEHQGAGVMQLPIQPRSVGPAEQPATAAQLRAEGIVSLAEHRQETPGGGKRSVRG